MPSIPLSFRLPMTVVRASFSTASIGLVASLGLTACGGSLSTSGGTGAGASGSTSSAASTSSGTAGTGCAGTGSGGGARRRPAQGTSAGTGGGATGAPSPSRYTPEWAGVTAVTVVGAIRHEPPTGTRAPLRDPHHRNASGAGGPAPPKLAAAQYPYFVRGDGRRGRTTANTQALRHRPRAGPPPAYIKCPAGPTAGARPQPLLPAHGCRKPAADATVQTSPAR